MRVLVVVNVRAGGGDAGLYDFVRVVGLAGHEVVLRFATGGLDIQRLLVDATSFDRVVACGGDGTVSAVCYAIRDTGIPVLVYPAGTANLLGGNLGLPVEPRALAEVLLGGSPVGFDLGELERVMPDGSTLRTGFAVIAGAGYDAAIMEGAEPLKSTLGAAAYLLAAVSNLAPTPAEFVLELDGKTVETDGIAVLLANFARIQFDLPVTPGTDPRDGKFEVAVVRTKNIVGLLPAVAAAVLDRTGEHPDRSPSIDVYSASFVRVEADPPLRMQFDGEVLETYTPFSARALPSAATLLVPEGSPFDALDARTRSTG